ncbi:MAG: RNA 2',3'-cyclic phosphodiesterase [Salinirussus sp.]
MRLFVSVDLSDLAEGISDVQALFGEPSGLRFTDPEQAHVTLKFLGDTDPADLTALREALTAAVEAADVGPFEARIAGLGVFPSREYINVVWLGVEADGAMVRLHNPIEARTTDLGFDPTDHDFTPHTTIARMDHAGGKERVQRVLEEHDPVVGTTRIDAVHLMESTLTDDGPEYETVDRIPV